MNIEKSQSNPTDAATNPSSRRFEFLDGLRGVAALLVVIFHFNTLLKENLIFLFPQPLEWLINRGHVGVEIFFVLSGFVIAYCIRNQQISFKYISDFFLKRSIRLDFPYWVALSLMIGIYLVGNILKGAMDSTPIDAKEIFLSFFYLNDAFGVERILPVSWTLALEIQFYLFLVLFVMGIQSLNQKSFQQPLSFSKFSLILISMTVLISLLQNTPFGPLPDIPGIFIPYWYSFVIGCIICWTMLSAIPHYFFWLNFVTITLYALATQKPFSIETCFAALLIYTVAMKGKMHTYLTSPIFQYLGKISYSLYLVHWLIGIKVITFYFRLLRPENENTLLLLGLFSAAIIFSIIAADLFYRFVELPSLHFSRQFKSQKLSKISVEEPSVSLLSTQKSLIK